MSNKDKAKRCSVCSKVFKNSQALGRHMSAKHPGVKADPKINLQASTLLDLVRSISQLTPTTDEGRELLENVKSTELKMRLACLQVANNCYRHISELGIMIGNINEVLKEKFTPDVLKAMEAEDLLRLMVTAAKISKIHMDMFALSQVPRQNGDQCYQNVQKMLENNLSAATKSQPLSLPPVYTRAEYLEMIQKLALLMDEWRREKRASGQDTGETLGADPVIIEAQVGWPSRDANS